MYLHCVVGGKLPNYVPRSLKKLIKTPTKAINDSQIFLWSIILMYTLLNNSMDIIVQPES